MLFCTVFSRHCPLSITAPLLMQAPASNYTLRRELPCGRYLSMSRLHLLNKIWILVLDHPLNCGGTYWHMNIACVSLFMTPRFWLPFYEILLWLQFFLNYKIYSDQVEASAWFFRKPGKTGQRKEVGLSTGRGVV